MTNKVIPLPEWLKKIIDVLMLMTCIRGYEVTHSWIFIILGIWMTLLVLHSIAQVIGFIK